MDVHRDGVCVYGRNPVRGSTDAPSEAAVDAQADAGAEG